MTKGREAEVENQYNLRDYITVKDEEGNNRAYAVEALFDIEDETYAMLRSEGELVVMRVEGDEEQYLEGVTDLEMVESILNAYQISIAEAPADEIGRNFQ